MTSEGNKARGNNGVRLLSLAKSRTGFKVMEMDRVGPVELSINQSFTENSKNKCVDTQTDSQAQIHTHAHKHVLEKV